ncbi:MAG: hypothetical protein JSW55_10635 [Chloroflexota bacterium]|nr:MAG: hypothetical protein JSW55_10635 [Chloroflexota bacterium]
MGKPVLLRATFIGAIILVISVLVLILVPTITADFIQVGNANKDAQQNCIMLDPGGKFVELDPGAGQVEVFLNETPGSEYPHDVVAVLKCRTTFDNPGSAVTYSGANQTNCVAYFNPDDLTQLSFTTTWSETISGSGNAVLTCQFKRDTPNN